MEGYILRAPWETHKCTCRGGKICIFCVSKKRTLAENKEKRRTRMGVHTYTYECTCTPSTVCAGCQLAEVRVRKEAEKTKTSGTRVAAFETWVRESTNETIRTTPLRQISTTLNRYPETDCYEDLRTQRMLDAFIAGSDAGYTREERTSQTRREFEGLTAPVAIHRFLQDWPFQDIDQIYEALRLGGYDFGDIDENPAKHNLKISLGKIVGVCKDSAGRYYLKQKAKQDA